ncbi:Malonyl CoA-acyl carrier protein transacylase [Candidatus Erwinia haradaeae]|uniref:Malonyl CoA-acyl carrier protein transacylase n=1 Tax=Candidatus Erwinia haradaeae TaxID=1922217 RepID=A0A451DDE4_9GAMM|nr:Malonyl CoA-acyl carrier protein transacylase [Candidatus Erwinia haradaeae]
MIKLAIVFPGQGSQSIGMLAHLAEENDIVESTFDEASEVLGYNLWHLVQKGSSEKLNQTWHAQPAILAASVSIFRIWQKNSKNMPTVLAGHSLGEYSALVCAKVLSFSDAIKLVDLRGKLMQEAVPENEGAMQVILGLDVAVIEKACKESAHGQIVSPVIFNAPNQIVIAGHKAAVERTSMACKTAGAKCTLRLPISIPSHCTLMRSAAAKLEITLKTIQFNTPIYPVVNNVDVMIETSLSAIRSALIRQMYQPVRWEESIQCIAEQGINLLLEMGPGKTLQGLTKRIVSTLKSVSINDPDTLATALKQSQGYIL